MGDKKRRIAFFFTMGLFYLSSCLVHPVTPALIVERGLDSAMFGVALAGMNTMNFLFSPVWGQLCRRYPPRRLLLISCLGYAAGQMAFAAAHTEAMVMAGRMFAGIFVGGVFTTASSYVLDTSPDPEARGQNLTVMVTIQSVLNAVGYFVGGMLGVFSVETAFAVQGGTLAAAGLLFFALCRGRETGEEKPPLTWRMVNPFAAFLSMGSFLTPMLGLLFLVAALSGIGQNSFEQCFNFYLRDQFGLSSAYNGAFKAAIAVVSLLANATLGLWLQRRTDTRRSFFWVMAGCTVPLWAILAFDSLVPFAVVDILFFGFNAVRLPILQNLAASMAKPDTGSMVMGFYNSMNSLGGILGALFAGLIYDAGPRYPFVLAAAAFLGATAVSGLCAFRRK